MSELQQLALDLWAEIPTEDKFFLFVLMFLGIALQKVRTNLEKPFAGWVIPAVIMAVSIAGMATYYGSFYYALSRGVGYGAGIISVYELGLKYLLRGIFGLTGSRKQ